VSIQTAKKNAPLALEFLGSRQGRRADSLAKCFYHAFLFATVILFYLDFKKNAAFTEGGISTALFMILVAEVIRADVLLLRGKRVAVPPQLEMEEAFVR
jgi:hypothetical protein